MKEIELTRGFKSIIDDDDYEKVSKYSWYCGETGYAKRLQRIPKTKQQKVFYLHRVILNITDDVEVDHINRNKLDNRKENLRICTRSQNQINRNLQSNNTSGYKGVNFMKKLNRWRARIKVQNKEIYLGTFDTSQKASVAYNEAAIKYFGEFARLNEV